jgi:paraquat-inducible protein A
MIGAASPSCWLEIFMRKSNPHAVTLAVFALLLLGAGVIGPFMAVTTLGVQSSYSLLETVEHLFHHRQNTLGVVVLLFSIIFPLSKIIFIVLVATHLAPLSDAVRRRLLAISEKTARFSMVDVMVVALLIVVLKVEGFAEVEVAWGTGCFFGSVLLSILAGLMVDTSRFAGTPRDVAMPMEEQPAELPDAAEGPVPYQPSRSLAWFVGGLGVVMILASVSLQQLAPSSILTGILVKYKASVIPALEIGEDDLYLLLATERDGEMVSHQTETKPVLRLGNGITWDLSGAKIPLASLRKISIYDEDLIYDDEYDAVDVTLGEPLSGSTYEFVIHSSSPWFAAIKPLLYSGIALLVIGGIMLLRHAAK